MRNYWQFIQQGWPLLGFGFLAVFFGNLGQSFFVSWYGAHIQADLGLSASIYGSVYSLATLISGTVLMIVGGFIDKWPLRRFAIFVATGLFVGCMVLSVTHSVVTLILGFFLIRLFGQGLFPHTGITVIARSFTNTRGKALSIATAGVPVGEVVLPLLAVLLIATFGWQMSWFVFGVLVPVVFLPCMFFVVRRAHALGLPVDPVLEPHTDKAEVSSSGRKEVLKDYRFWLALPVLLTGPFVVTGIFIHQGYVLTEKSWTPEWFATCFIFYGVVHGIGSMGVGFLIDRFSAVRLLPFKALPIVAALLLLAFVDGGWVAWCMLGLLGISIGCGGPIVAALWVEVYGSSNIGAIRSMVSSFAIWSTALSPILFGVLIDNGVSIQALMTGVAVYVLAATMFAFAAYRRGNQE